jgi:hypothetical protein
VHCGQCGQLNPEGFKFCSKCGAPAAAPPSWVATPQSATPFTGIAPTPLITGATSPGFDWNRVMRYEAITTVGAFLTLVGFYLPWLSAFGFSVSGIGAHSYLWLAWLCLVAVIVLSIVKMFSPGFTQTWPYQNLLVGLILFSSLLVFIAFIGTLSGSYWSFGPFWTLLMAAATSVAALAPLINGLDFLRVPVSSTPSHQRSSNTFVSPAPTSTVGSSRFCGACGAPVDTDEPFCSHCGSKIDG